MLGNTSTKQVFFPKKAYSLIEAMIALFLLMSGLLLLCVSFQTNIEQTLSAKNGMTASMIADSIIAEMSNTNPDEWDMNTLKNEFYYDFNGNRINSASYDGNNYFKATVTSTLESAGYYDVEVLISWEGWKKEASRVGMDVMHDEQAFSMHAHISPTNYAVD